MEFQGENSKHDALDALLRRYLVEREEAGLLESTGEQVLAGPPKMTPTAEREADMIRRLKLRFPDRPETIAPKGWNLRPILIATGAIAVLTTLTLLWFDPLGSNKRFDGSNTDVLSGQGTAADIHDADDPYRIGIEENISLQEGNGNPVDPEVYSVPGIGDGNQEHPAHHRPWIPHSRPSNMVQQGHPDSRSVSPNLFAPLVPQTVVPYSAANESYDPFPLRGLYAQTSTQSRFYLLEPNKDHLIRGRKGTLLHIPKMAFVDASSGEAVTELVQVEVKEVYNRSDYLKTNLPTVSNGRQLVSGGVVYVDAVSAGRRLSLAKGKDIYVEITPDPSIDVTDMELHVGSMSERGEVNWVSSNAAASKMVPLNLDKIYFDEFYCDCKGEKLWNNLLWALTDVAYANTWIATREFRQRLHALAEINYYSLGLMTYRDNVDKDLWKVDKMVANMLRELVPQGLAKEDEVERFEAFAREMLTQTESFNDHGIDLSRPDAPRQLLYRKVSREETERLLRMDRLRREYADEIATRLVLADNGAGTYVVRVKPGYRKGSPKRGIRAFNVRHLGWMNLSRPMLREMVNLRSTDLKVRLTGEVPYESTRTFLVYTQVMSIVPGSLTTGQLFRFKDIPRNSEAKIVAIGFKDGFPYLGIEGMPRENGEQITTIAMHRMQIDDYLNALAALD